MRQRNQVTDSNHSGTPPFPIEEPLLTQTEAANLLHVEPRTLESWRQRRTGPHYIRYSLRCVRYRLQDLRLDKRAGSRNRVSKSNAPVAARSDPSARA